MVDLDDRRTCGTEPPVGLVEEQSGTGRRQLDAWWASLAPDERASVTAVWARGDFVLAEVDRGELVVLLEARFVAPEDRDDGIVLEPEEDWLTRTALLEWLYAHPELLPGARVFHICRAHPRAQQVLLTGRIPAGFSCPLAQEGCPMRRLLAHRPGHDVRLSLVAGDRVRARRGALSP